MSLLFRSADWRK